MNNNTTNIRQSLYQCLENRLNIKTTDNTILLCQSSDNIHGLTIYLTLKPNETSPLEDFLAITISNGEYCCVEYGNIYTRDNPENSIKYLIYKKEENGKFSYYLNRLKANTDIKIYDEEFLIIRKEIKYGQFDNLLTSVITSLPENVIKMLEVDEEVPLIANGHFVVAGETAYINKLHGRTNLSEIKNFDKIASNKSSNSFISSPNYYFGIKPDPRNPEFFIGDETQGILNKNSYSGTAKGFNTAKTISISGDVNVELNGGDGDNGWKVTTSAIQPNKVLASHLGLVTDNDGSTCTYNGQTFKIYQAENKNALKIDVTNFPVKADQFTDNKSIICGEVSDISFDTASGGGDAGDWTIDNIKLNTNIITGGTDGHITQETITDYNLASKTITSASIADKTITGDQIADKTITEDKLAVGIISNASIKDGTIANEKLVKNSIILGETEIHLGETSKQIQNLDNLTLSKGNSKINLSFESNNDPSIIISTDNNAYKTIIHDRGIRPIQIDSLYSVYSNGASSIIDGPGNFGPGNSAPVDYQDDHYEILGSKLKLIHGFAQEVPPYGPGAEDYWIRAVQELVLDANGKSSIPNLQTLMLDASNGGTIKTENLILNDHGTISNPINIFSTASTYTDKDETGHDRTFYYTKYSGIYLIKFNAFFKAYAGRPGEESVEGTAVAYIEKHAKSFTFPYSLSVIAPGVDEIWTGNVICKGIDRGAIMGSTFPDIQTKNHFTYAFGDSKNISIRKKIEWGGLYYVAPVPQYTQGTIQITSIIPIMTK